jgi:hypothetical protein
MKQILHGITRCAKTIGFSLNYILGRELQLVFGILPIEKQSIDRQALLCLIILILQRVVSGKRLYLVINRIHTVFLHMFTTQRLKMASTSC